MSKLRGWEPGCYYKTVEDMPVGITEWGVTDDVDMTDCFIPAETILLLKGIITRLVTLGGDDGMTVTTENEYLRFVFIDPRFPGERRVLCYDKNWGMRRDFDNYLSPLGNKITSPLIMLALVEAGL